MSSSILIFTKIPGYTPCKTRLANSADLSEKSVTNLATAFLYDSIVLANAVSNEKLLLYSLPKASEKLLDELFSTISLKLPNNVANKIIFKEQIGDSFSNRIHNAFSNFPTGAVMIGSDCPHLSPEIIKKALALVNEGYLVAGPTNNTDNDGLYLIGIPKDCNVSKSELETIFTNDNETTQLNRFSQLAKKLDKPFAILENSFDIDYAEDLKKLTDYIQRTPSMNLKATRLIINKLPLKL